MLCIIGQHWRRGRPTTKSMGGRRDQPAPFTADRRRSGASGSRALPLSDGVQLVGRIDLLSRSDRKDRSHAEGPDERRRESGRSRGLAERQSSRCLVRWRRGAHFPAGDHLAASAGFAGRSDQSDRRLRSRDPGGRRRCLSASAAASWRRERQAFRQVFTLGRAEYGVDLLSAVETVGSAAARDLAGPDDVAALSYTGGTTGKSKGALRRHRELSGFAGAVLANFEIPDTPRFLAVAPISHVAGTKVLPTLMRGGTVHLVRGFDPEAVLAAIARERINFTLLVPTMIYVLLDHPALSRDRSVFARIAPLRRFADFAEPFVRGPRTHRTSVLSALRSNGMLSDRRSAQVGPRSKQPGTCPFMRFSRRRVRGQDSRRRRPGGRRRRARRDLRAFALRDGRILEAPRTDRLDAAQWMASHRRHRARRRARLHVHSGSKEGHDRQRRVQYLSAGSGGRAG